MKLEWLKLGMCEIYNATKLWQQNQKAYTDHFFNLMKTSLLDLKNEYVGSNLNKTLLSIRMEFRFNLIFQFE